MAGDATDIPAIGGAYVLAIRLRTRLKLMISALSGLTLASGLYLYCGNAYGPGGLAARIARHRRDGKNTHWHIDRLTGAGRIEAVAVREGGDECDLVAALLVAGATVPIPGFGSSDCRRCKAHLLTAPGGFDGAALEDIVTLGRHAAEPL